MKISTFSFIITFIGLTLGNFFFQSISLHDYARAVDRSVMQFFALLAVWLASKLNMY